MFKGIQTGPQKILLYDPTQTQRFRDTSVLYRWLQSLDYSQVISMLFVEDNIERKCSVHGQHQRQGYILE